VTIPIGVVGLIRSDEKRGLYIGWYIKVFDDTEESGGYYILQSRSKDFRGEGYDDWVLPEHLEGYFAGSGWELDWDI
jgi:hypothetical protein